MKQNEVKQFNKLIKNMASGNENALDEFLNLYGKVIYAIALTVTKSHFLADEIVFDTLHKIWRTSDRIPKIKTPLGWLYTITVNCAKNKLKSEQRLYAICENPQESKIDEILNEDEFYSFLSPISEVQQQILIFKFVEDMSFQTIAKELKMPLSSVSSNYYRAIEKIKKKFFK